MAKSSSAAQSSSSQRKPEKIFRIGFVSASVFAHDVSTEVASFLNDVFERLTLAIFEQDGTVDKFIGDAIMAIFGAPVVQDDHALRAVRAAIRMQNELDKYNLEVFGSHKIRMRIGVNSGPAVAGEIGSSKRRDYTVIGDTVNVASRLESSAALPHQVVIGQQTYEAVKGRINCVALEPCVVKGKADPIQSYLVVEADSSSDVVAQA